MTAKPSLGYVGVGLMGLPMVKRLRSLGYAVRAYDIVPDRVEAARAAGAVAAASPADAASGADLVLLNLPTTEAVEQAVFGDGGVASVVRRPQLLIDFSTIKVEKCKAFAAKLREKTAVGWIDAPVSGGPPASGSARSRSWRAASRPTSSGRGRSSPTSPAASRTWGRPAAAWWRRCSTSSSSAAAYAVMAEAAVLAEAAGIDAARLPECLAGGHADGSLLQRIYPRMVQRDFAPQGYARQLLKDLEMVNEFAGGMKAPTPMMGEALSLYRMLVHLGYAELDTSAIFKLYGREPAERACVPGPDRRVRATTDNGGDIDVAAHARSRRHGRPAARRPGAVKLRYAHVGVANAPQTLYADEVAKLVKERTGGRVDITVFAELVARRRRRDGGRRAAGSISMGHHDFASLGKFVSTWRCSTRRSSTATPPQPARDRPAHLGGGAGDQQAARREAQRPHHRQLLPGHPAPHLEGEGALAEGHAGQEVPRRAGEAVVVDVTGMGAVATPVEVSELATALATGLVVGQENPLAEHLQPQAVRGAEVRDADRPHAVVLCVFVNRRCGRASRRRPQDHRGHAAEVGQKTLAWDRETNEKYRKELEAKGMTFVGEKDGLDIEAFRRAVLAQVDKDFPEWTRLHRPAPRGEVTDIQGGRVRPTSSSRRGRDRSEPPLPPRC